MAKHRVNWNLDLGTSKHKEGDEIDLDAELSAHLTPLGVVTPLEGETPAEVETIEPEKLAKLNKAQLVEYAKAKFGEDVAGTKDEILASIAALVAAKAAE